MRLDETLRPAIDRELAAVDHRLRAARHEAMAAMSAIGVILAVLAVVSGWSGV